MKNQSSGGQSITGAAAQQSEGWAPRPPSHGAGVRLGVQGVLTAQQAPRPPWANCIQCPRAQRGWHTLATERRKGPCAWCLFVCCWSSSHVGVERISPVRLESAQDQPSQPLPGQGKRLGCRPWRNQETQEQRKGPHRRPLLPPIGDVPLTAETEAGPQDVSLGGERQGRQGPQPQLTIDTSH